MSHSHSTHQNKEYFDNEAANYDSKHEKTIEQLINELQSNLDFIGVDWVSEEDDEDDETPGKRPVRLLDYACGTGLVSRALAPYTTQCLGIDLSSNMVAAYNARASNQGLSRKEMYAHQGNFCDPKDSTPSAFAGPEFFDFDIAAVGLGFHHFDDPELAARRLVERLCPGGVLMVIDFLPHEAFSSEQHPAAATVVHHGFTENRIREIFQRAGAGEGFALRDVGVAFNKLHGGEDMRRKVFFARGTKG